MPSAMALALEAEDPPPPGTLFEIIKMVSDAVLFLIPLAVAAALLVFFWGLVKFIRKAGNDDDHAEGRALMIWGIIALFVMLTVWGLVAFFSTALGIGVGGACPPPSLPEPGDDPSQKMDDCLTN